MCCLHLGTRSSRLVTRVFVPTVNRYEFLTVNCVNEKRCVFGNKARIVRRHDVSVVRSQLRRGEVRGAEPRGRLPPRVPGPRVMSRCPAAALKSTSFSPSHPSEALPLVLPLSRTAIPCWPVIYMKSSLFAPDAAANVFVVRVPIHYLK